MHLEQLQYHFDKRRDNDGLVVVLHPGATDNELDSAEVRIGKKFPAQVRAFYSRHNGLAVDDPKFEILPVHRLSADGHFRIHFATAEGLYRMCFDCSRLNEAEQWDIVDAETGDRITHTMASFWSNKMWKWIDRRLAFWRGLV